jgi:hypothetical protein
VLADVFLTAEGRIAGDRDGKVFSAGRGLRAGHAHKWVPQEPGRSFCLLRDKWVRFAQPKGTRPKVSSVCAVPKERTPSRWTEVPIAEDDPKVMGMDREKSERPDSTEEAGERVLPDPVEGSGASCH